MATFGFTGTGSFTQGEGVVTAYSGGNFYYQVRTRYPLLENGKLTKLSAYTTNITHLGGTQQILLAVYTPAWSQAATTTAITVTKTADTLSEQTLGTAVFLTAGDYYLAAVGTPGGDTTANAVMYIKTESGAGVAERDTVGGFAFESPYVNDYVDGSRKHCIFGTYTPLSSVITTSPGVFHNSLTLNGNITTAPNGNITMRGFVYDTVSRTQPNNLAPVSSGYTFTTSETGTYSIGTYSLNASSLTPGIAYYIRSFVQDSEGYSYGNEIIAYTSISRAFLTA